MAILNRLRIQTPSPLSAVTYLTLVSVISVLVACLITRLSTTIRYRLALQRFPVANPSKPSPPPSSPPTLPYTIPWLGLALSFLNEEPGHFLRFLQRQLARTPSKLDVITILLGGKRSYILTTPATVQWLFKAGGRQLSRDPFNREVMTKGMGLGPEDERKVYDDQTVMESMSHDINTRFLLNAAVANGLTRNFMHVLRESIDQDSDVPPPSSAGDGTAEVQIEMYEWLKTKMFTASVTALMGSKVLEMNPRFCEQYWDFDNTVLHRLFGLPRWLKPRAYEALDEILDSSANWITAVMAEHYTKGEKSGQDLSPVEEMEMDEQEWDPLSGAKAVRARHRLYAQLGLSSRGCASFDIGYLFALASNAIPCTGWILSHLLAPNNSRVLAIIQKELETAKRPNGVIDVATLATLPYLTAAFLETMRMYVNLMVSRELKSDMVLLDRYALRKGDIVIAPSFLGHRHTSLWSDLASDLPPEDVWCVERFLRRDEATGETTVSTAGTTGAYFPFGGGAQMCPGRVFAKQEVLGAVAAFLLTFHVDFVEFVRTDKAGRVVSKGKQDKGFPAIKKQYAGAGVVSMEGDLRVRLRRREW